MSSFAGANTSGDNDSSHSIGVFDMWAAQRVPSVQIAPNGTFIFSPVFRNWVREILERITKKKSSSDSSDDLESGPREQEGY